MSVSGVLAAAVKNTQQVLDNGAQYITGSAQHIWAGVTGSIGNIINKFNKQYWLQEYECEIASSGDTLINSSKLSYSIVPRIISLIISQLSYPKFGGDINLSLK